ncbi:MAG: hypothetical protein WCX95_04890 [Candidatus Gracilibacteria bacterium]
MDYIRGAEEGVRPQYGKGVKYIGIMANDFDCPMGPEDQQNLQVLFDAVECIDRYIDSQPSIEEMDEMFDQIIGFLQENNTQINVQEGQGPLPQELLTQLATLKEMLGQIENRDDFFAHVVNLKEITHRLRITRDVRQYVADSLSGGKETAALSFSVMDENRFNQAFKDFFELAGATGNLIDDIVDAKADYANGEIALKPNIGFYLIALGHAIKNLVKAAWLYPKKMKRLRMIKAPLKQLEERRRIC